MLKKIIGVIKEPAYIFRYLSRNGLLGWLNDEQYLKIVYRLKMGQKLNLENPTTFNEKLQWLKLNERNALYSIMVDKIQVKEYVSSIIGEQYLVPTLGVWENAEEIDFDLLPEQFVLKCNHDSSSIIFCKNKQHLNKEEAVKKLNRCLKNNGYLYGREWPYKNVKPKVFAEPYLKDDTIKGDSLCVYKFFTFSGKPTIIQTIQNDKTKDESIDYFDCDWNLLDLRQNFPNSKKPLSKPKKLKEMIELAEKLSEGFGFLRVDFYEVNNSVIFSEFTFFSDDGMNAFVPNKWDYDLGNLIDLSIYKDRILWRK